MNDKTSEPERAERARASVDERPDFWVVEEAARAAEAATPGLLPEAQVVPDAPRLTQAEAYKVLHDKALAEEFGPIVPMSEMVDEVVTVERVERYRLNRKPVWLFYIRRSNGEGVRSSVNREAGGRTPGRDEVVEAIFGAAPIAVRVIAYRPRRRRGVPQLGFGTPDQPSPVPKAVALKAWGGLSRASGDR